MLDRFYRDEGGATAGSGLGLAIVRKLAQRHGASLSLDKGETRRFDITVGALQSDRSPTTAAAGHDHGRLGILARSLAAGEGNEGGLADGGVVVENVSGPAAKAGIQPGDVILSLNSTPVKSPDQLRDLVSKADSTVALLVQRGNARIFVPVELG